MVNEKDLTHPLLLKHMSPCFQSGPDDYPRTKDLSHFAEMWRESMVAMPDMRVSDIDPVAFVHDDGRRAKVWTSKRISGMSGSFCKEAVSILSWERGKGQVWVCVNIRKMQGVSEYV